MNVFENGHLFPQSEPALDIRHLTPDELLQFGMAEFAYVKAVELDDGTAFAIHAADGSPMAVAPNQDLAVAAILQHEMTASLVH